MAALAWRTLIARFSEREIGALQQRVQQIEHARRNDRTVLNGLDDELAEARDWKDGACADANVPTNALLGRWVTRLPTPTAGDSKASGAAGYSTESGRHSGTTLTDVAAGAASEGRSGMLNPRFSEWMQGLPNGWISSGPLEMSELLQWFTHAHSSLWPGDSQDD